jgi:hypothetical protein
MVTIGGIQRSYNEEPLGNTVALERRRRCWYLVCRLTTEINLTVIAELLAAGDNVKCQQASMDYNIRSYKFDAQS